MTRTLAHSLHETGSAETVLPVAYAFSYSDETKKALIQDYKFSQSDEAGQALATCLIDVHIGILSQTGVETAVWGSPPSTMHARGEKVEDSVWELLQIVRFNTPFYFNIQPKTHVFYKRIFSLKTTFLKGRRAQHINGSRSSRISHISDRYCICLRHKLFLWWHIAIMRNYRLSYTLCDDVASTGATLLACSTTLRDYLAILQRKRPRLSFDIRVFSLAH